MPITFDNNVATVTITATLLQQRRLNACLIQVPKVSLDDIRHDRSRPGSLGAFRDLLAGGNGHERPVIESLFGADHPILILAPEYALSSRDWHAVDEYVRGSSRSIIFIVGFGATPFQEVLNWKRDEVAGATERHLSWQGEQEIGAAALVNGGWCWIHRVGGPQTTCVTFLKNWFAVHDEVAVLPELQGGQSFITLKFDDLQIFPFLCSDLIRAPEQDGQTGRQRLRAALAAEENPKHVLVTGSIYQTSPHNANWQIAITDVVGMSPTVRSVVVAIANQACCKPLPAENEDRWRLLTGAFCHRNDLFKAQDSLPTGRAVQSEVISGAVARHTDPCIIAGEIVWPPYNTVVEGFVWKARTRTSILADGLAPTEVPGTAIDATELYRYTIRNTAPDEFHPNVNDGLEQIRRQVKDSGASATRLIKSMVFGLDRRELHADRLHTVAHAFIPAMYSLACLKAVGGVTWQTNTAEQGQLHYQAQDAHILVWRDPEKSEFLMRRIIGEWMRALGNHPKLLIVGAGVDGSPLPTGPFHGDRRDMMEDDVDDGALEVAGTLADVPQDITRAGRSQVALLGLNEVTEWYRHRGPAATAGARRKVQALINTLQFPVAAAA